jgi:hypothetical protein
MPKLVRGFCKQKDCYSLSMWRLQLIFIFRNSVNQVILRPRHVYLQGKILSSFCFFL